MSTGDKHTVAAISQRLHSSADKRYAQKSTRFFKTGPGEYAEHDRFLGIRVPALRALTKEYRSAISLQDCCTLLQNEWHEFRLFALLCMVELYQRGNESQKQAVVKQYFGNKKHINNWDLVDASAYKIPGPWYYDKDRAPLHRMIKSKSLWERRIPILSTFYYIRQNDLDDTYRYSTLLMNDPEDLIHKATGWMLREAGKRDKKRLIDYLEKHHEQMPRVMLSYAIEKFPATEKARYKRR
ncbi:MAG: DNA alkylation repair protein [Pseudomonadota bacterium]